MRPRAFTGALALVAVGAVISHAVAQQNSSASVVARLLEHVQKLEADLADFRKLEGSVLAFDLPNGCPDGWSDFKEASGRFIIGVNGDKYRLPYEKGEPNYHTGGKEEHTLTPKEMPKHIHHYGAWVPKWVVDYKHQISGENSGQMTGGDEAKAGTFKTIPEDIEEGRDQARVVQSIDIRPPYIALYFCKKK